MGAWRVAVTFGVISSPSDFVDEGARSISVPPLSWSVLLPKSARPQHWCSGWSPGRSLIAPNGSGLGLLLVHFASYVIDAWSPGFVLGIP